MNQFTYSRISLAIAFLSGALLVLSYRDLYPKLEERYQQRKSQRRFSAENKDDAARQELTRADDDDVKRDEDGMPLVRDVKEGIEGCIGNTPLIRIVSMAVGM